MIFSDEEALLGCLGHGLCLNGTAARLSDEDNKKPTLLSG